MDSQDDRETNDGLSVHELQILCKELRVNIYEDMTYKQQELAVCFYLKQRIEEGRYKDFFPLQRKACKVFGLVPNGSSNNKFVAVENPFSTPPNPPLPRSQRILRALQKYNIEDDGTYPEKKLWVEVRKHNRKIRKMQKLALASPIPFTQSPPKQEFNMKTKVISFINLKGGVAKTTTTVGTAECLAAKGYKVLVIDLDPQTNATIMILGEERWKALDEKGYTLATLFDDAFKTDSVFELEKTIQHNFSDVEEARANLDLLPSSVKMIKSQIELAIRGHNATTRFLWKILSEALKGQLSKYDYVLIDCPPSLDNITRNGLYLSDGYVIPTIPDYLSSYGIPQIVDEIEYFQGDKCGDRKIQVFGVLRTKVMKNDKVHMQMSSILERETFAPCFSTIFTQTTDLSGAAQRKEYLRSRKEKWGKAHAPVFQAFTEELIAKFN